MWQDRRTTTTIDASSIDADTIPHFSSSQLIEIFHIIEQWRSELFGLIDEQ
jgi:hypothetical protein